MSDKNSKLVYSRATESEDKFDYFIAAITGAVLAYSLQSYSPQKWGIDSQTLEPVALIILFFSFFLGLLRIQSVVCAAKFNVDSLRFGELCSDLKDAYQNGVMGGTEPGTGRQFSRIQMPELIQDYQMREIVAHASCKNETETARKHYLWRNRLLVFGFGILLVSKILAPY